MSREILKSIINEFDTEKFIRFFREKNRKFTPRTEVLAIYNDDDFSNCLRIGKVDFQGGTYMTICSLNTDKSLTERSGKKSQYEKGKKILKETQSDSGIFIFYDRAGNFRFSLIYANYLGKKRDWSTFKRFTYFVSKDFTNKTFIQRIGDSDFSSLENIKDGFSVEKVNKEFFNEIAIKFSELVGGQRAVRGNVEKFKPLIKLPSTDDHQKMQEFAVRMIGRIVFCWFLKKKKSKNGIPLIPDNLLSGNAVENNKNYYHSVLEKLFFEVLNTKQEVRKEFKGYELYKDIPFLNGGLFEPQDDDLYKPSLINSLIIPDKWIYEFFNILESYNFTIDENTSNDVELSIDPEMLGRIFENLLAEINPDTGETARNLTGSYYTPRPIVEYMVDESLKQYLISRTDIPESKLSMLLSYNSEETEISNKESVIIINALDKIKILDPACGSGAFPIGILQKMVLILQKIDKNSSKWLEKKLNKIESSVLRRELKEKFMSENLDYIRKLGLIQDSIYGVDIQSIAVEISKLRCFLTLIVDEDVDDKKPNRGIIPLPNLEFKFVAANTLISLPEEEGSLFDESENIKQLEVLRDEYFTSYGQKKLDIESDYLSIQEKMFKKLLRNGINSGRAFELAGWFPFFNEKAKWFDPKWMFGIEDGFDIVIGNPPYISMAHLPEKVVSELIKQSYETFSKGADLYCLFYEKGIWMLKTNGILTYISSNRFCFTNYGIGLRKYLSKKNILELINFNETDVFESANVGSIIALIQNVIPTKNKILIFEAKGDEPTLRIQTEKKYSNKEFYKEQQWSFDENHVQILKKKIESKGISFVKWKGIAINRGVTTGANSVFLIPESIKSKLIKEHSSSKEIIKPILRGRDIKRFTLEWSGDWLIFTRRGINIEKYPAIKKYLSQYRNELEPGIGRKKGNYKWFEIQDNTSFYTEFEKRKLIWTRLSNVNAFSISSEKEFSLGSTSFAVGENLEYLTSILNSKVILFYFKLGSVIWGKDGIKWFGEYFDNIPIPEISEKEQQPFKSLVDKIMKMKSLARDSTSLENQIDVMVYKLYGLTYDEVKLVDPEFWMSVGEYEKFSLEK